MDANNEGKEGLYQGFLTPGNRSRNGDHGGRTILWQMDMVFAGLTRPEFIVFGRYPFTLKITLLQSTALSDAF